MCYNNVIINLSQVLRSSYMFKPINHVFATFLRKLTTAAKKDMAGKARRHMSRPWWALFWSHLLPCTCCSQRSERRILAGMEIPALQPQLRRDTSDGQARPSARPPGISPNHNGITSERRLGESDFIIWGCRDICADRKKGAQGPLAPLPCQPAFYY